MSNLKIAVCQSSPHSGDFTGNVKQIIELYNCAVEKNAHIALFSECAVSGYFCADMFLKPSFLNHADSALQVLVNHTRGKKTALIVGTTTQNKTGASFEKPYNSAVVIENGKIIATRHKQQLSDVGVCKDSRFFAKGAKQNVIKINNVKIALTICQDIWTADVCEQLKSSGARLILVCNASPFDFNKLTRRLEVARKITKNTGCPLIYCNAVGGYDNTLIDGGSFALDGGGLVKMQAPQFETGVYMCEVNVDDSKLQVLETNIVKQPNFCETVWTACVFSLREYMRKNGFSKIVLGMSGGIDSAISCAMASDAVGKKNVLAVMMPSKYTSKQSIEDCNKAIELMGVEYKNIPINQMVETFENNFKLPYNKSDLRQVTSQNIQARIRGMIILAISNDDGHLALSTGNKSEVAVGYCTLYGDMCGGFNLLKDIYKTDVFKLAKWRNEISQVIPPTIISKPPTAELCANQRDTDNLPPYHTLDEILKALIELDLSLGEIVELGFDKNTVIKISKLVAIAQYKRNQAATGVKISAKDFERDRDYPISNAYTNFAIDDINLNSKP